ncbi:DUF2637 domain-containing protein [Dactylosporangium sp. NPDC005572]|uniref:DUF2637 domain-containing protein n=1 Tax=Dactylosporangium sp. NPDC005572 TaxID=3156889 RepID=UPI0033BA821A
MNGRIWAYVGTAVGGVASLAANIAHCYVPPAGAPAGWSPEFGAVVSATFWPVALFIAVEILARTVWPAGGWWKLARFGGLLPVALVAAVVSYRHLSGLITYYGEDRLTAIAGPAAVDGLMIMAAAALLASGKHREPAPAGPPAAEPAQPAPALAAVPFTERPRAVNGAIPSGVVR